MRRVLFLCTGNSARSQMAEAWAKHLGAGLAEFHSAGTRPAAKVSPYAIAVMAERGVSLESSTPKALEAVSQPLDLVVAVCGQAADECPVPPPNTEFQFWDLFDPTRAQGTEDEILEAFRRCRDEIERRVTGLIGELSVALPG